MYEEAIRTVMTVRDFTQVFDSYAQFEESMIAAKMETASELGHEEEGAMWNGAREERAGFLTTGVEQAVKERDWMDTGAKISWSSLNSVQAWQEGWC